MRIDEFYFKDLIGVIGISGPVGAGKTTTAEFIAKELPGNVVICALADALKEECRDALGYTVEEWATLLGNPETKEALRPLLQWWGTEYRRNPVLDGYQEYWFDSWMQGVFQEDLRLRRETGKGVSYVLVPDIRFPNEAEFIRKMGEFCVLLHIRGINQKRATSHEHVSENGVDVASYEPLIGNDQAKGLGELERIAKLFAQEYLYGIKVKTDSIQEHRRGKGETGEEAWSQEQDD